MPGNENTRAPDRWPHRLAGMLLILFGASHLAFLGVRDPSLDFRNTLFPFLTNWTLFLVAGLLEFALGVFCMSRCGAGLTNVLILTFVGVVLWYRWGFYYTGGTNCGCLGLLGRLLHVSKTHEEAIPLVALCVLFLTTARWFCGNCIAASKTIVRQLYPVIPLLLACHGVSGEQTIEVRGEVDMQDYNPATGTPHAQQVSHSTFIAVFSAAALRFSITNNDRPSWWAQVFCDSTNTYTLRPSGGKYGARNAPPQEDLIDATVEPSPRLILRDVDPIGVHMLWYTYGLSRNRVITNKDGAVELPLAGSLPRENPGAYGYKWLVTFSADGRFPAHFEVARDAKLDLATEKQEMLRPELDYPETLGTYNEYLNNLEHRRSLPTGWCKARYVCTEWYITNGIAIPAASRLEVNLFSRKAPVRPWREINLRVLNVSLRSSAESLVPAVTAATRVADYRYKRANETRIFKFAQYTLRPGEEWKSANDRVLLEQAEDWLNHGRKYTDFAHKGKRWLAWLFLVVIVAPAAFMVLKRNKAEQ